MASLALLLPLLRPPIGQLLPVLLPHWTETCSARESENEKEKSGIAKTESGTANEKGNGKENENGNASESGNGKGNEKRNERGNVNGRENGTGREIGTEKGCENGSGHEKIAQTMTEKGERKLPHHLHRMMTRNLGMKTGWFIALPHLFLIVVNSSCL